VLVALGLGPSAFRGPPAPGTRCWLILAKIWREAFWREACWPYQAPRLALGQHRGTKVAESNRGLIFVEATEKRSITRAPAPEDGLRWKLPRRGIVVEFTGSSCPL
jgi:hypothetical protein